MRQVNAQVVVAQVVNTEVVVVLAEAAEAAEMLEIIVEAEVGLESLSETVTSSSDEDSEEMEQAPDEGPVRFFEAIYRSPVEYKIQMSMSRGIFKAK